MGRRHFWRGEGTPPAPANENWSDPVILYCCLLPQLFPVAIRNYTVRRLVLCGPIAREFLLDRLKLFWLFLIFRLPRCCGPSALLGARQRRAPVVSGACSYPTCSMEELVMRTTNFDYAPLWRSTIGFDRLLDMVDAAQRAGSDDNFPPYNVERLGDDSYRISLAVAGFAPDEIAVTAEQNVLTIEGQKAEKEQGEYLYRGISARHFKRRFNLADYVQVKDATFENGLLRVELAREIPEAMKPRRIAINGATPSNVHQLDGKAA